MDVLTRFFKRLLAMIRSLFAMPSMDYDPDYAVPPWWLIEEYLDLNGMSPIELADKCCLSIKLVEKIIAGDASIEIDIADRFEKVLWIDATLLLEVQENYNRFINGWPPDPANRAARYS